MPTKLNNRPTAIPVHYGGASGFDWTNDPFGDPLERLSTAKNKGEPKQKRKYKARKPKHE